MRKKKEKIYKINIKKYLKGQKNIKWNWKKIRKIKKRKKLS